jgi:hypothetical protein
VAALVSAGVLGQVLLAGPAEAVTVAQASLKDGHLVVEGSGSTGGLFVTAESTTSAAGARADVQGRFKIEAFGFTAPDCKVTVYDSPTVLTTVSLSDCTPSVIPVPPTPAPPTGDCVITPQDPVTLAAGVRTSVYFATTGCDTTFDGTTTPTPVQWKVVAGVIPTGMTGPRFQGLTNGGIFGTPSIPGTYRFTLQATDQAGATDQESFTVVVE